MAKMPDYSDEFKRKAVKAYLSGESALSIAKRMGCSRPSIENWARLMKWSGGPKVGFGDPPSPPPASPEEEALWADPLDPPAPLPALIKGTTDEYIASVKRTLSEQITQMEERITLLSGEMESIEKLLPRMKTALAALEGA